MVPSVVVGFVLGHGLPTMVQRPTLSTGELAGLALAGFMTGLFLTDVTTDDLFGRFPALRRREETILLALWLLWPTVFVAAMTTVGRDFVLPAIVGPWFILGLGILWVSLDERRSRGRP